MEKVWVIYVPSQHRLFRESLLASCVSRRDWRAEGRRARVASIGAAEALCWAVDLGCTLSRKHQPHLTERDEGCRCACGCDAREGGTDAFGRVQWVS
jgi:hypothetical protein